MAWRRSVGTAASGVFYRCIKRDPDLAYRSGVMHCEDLSLETIARELGAPT
jgi:hypothetical protein